MQLMTKCPKCNEPIAEIEVQENAVSAVYRCGLIQAVDLPQLNEYTDLPGACLMPELHYAGDCPACGQQHATAPSR